MANTENLMIKISPELKALIKVEAEKLDMTMSQFVRFMIKQWSKRKDPEKQAITW